MSEQEKENEEIELIEIIIEKTKNWGSGDILALFLEGVRMGCKCADCEMELVDHLVNSIGEEYSRAIRRLLEKRK